MLKLLLDSDAEAEALGRQFLLADHRYLAMQAPHMPPHLLSLDQQELSASILNGSQQVQRSEVLAAVGEGQ